MLRRVVLSLRLVFLSSGVLSAVLIPLSLFVHITAICPWPTAQASEDNWQVVVVHVGSDGRYGTLRLSVLESEIFHQQRFEWSIAAERGPSVKRPLRLKPMWHRSSPFVVLYLPLW